MPTNAPAGRVLVPLDGSERAEAILPWLEHPQHPWGTEVVLIRSVTVDAATNFSTETEAGDYLATQARRLERAGLRVRCEVWHGTPTQAILNAAARRRVGLIAMTTHGRRGLDRLRFGSIAESVVRKARVPVLLVRGQMRWPTDRSLRTLVPLDGSTLSAAILTVVARRPQPLRGVVELLHILDVAPRSRSLGLPRAIADADPGRAAATKYLERVAALLADKGLEIEKVVVDGPVGPTIAERIAEGGADLVAMTTHGRSGVVRLWLGSVAEYVLRTAEIPVLLWRAPVPPVGTRGERRTEEARHAS
jgi:nucleotide-binding universal stress UspA family protein